MIDLRDLEPEEVEQRFQCRGEEYEARVFLKNPNSFVGAFRTAPDYPWKSCEWTFRGNCMMWSHLAALIPRREEVEVWAFALHYNGEWIGSCCTSLDTAETRVHSLKVGGYRTFGPERVVLKEDVE